MGGCVTHEVWRWLRLSNDWGVDFLVTGSSLRTWCHEASPYLACTDGHRRARAEVAFSPEIQALVQDPRVPRQERDAVSKEGGVVYPSLTSGSSRFCARR